MCCQQLLDGMECAILMNLSTTMYVEVDEIQFQCAKITYMQIDYLRETKKGREQELRAIQQSEKIYFTMRK